MGRMYSLVFQEQVIAIASGDYDLFKLQPADEQPVALHYLHLGQMSELGNSDEEQLRVAVIRGHTAGGSVSSTNAHPLNPNSPGTDTFCHIVDPSVMTGGTPVTVRSHIFSVISGLDVVYQPNNRPTCIRGTADERIVVRLMSAPIDDITMSGTLYFEELS